MTNISERTGLVVTLWEPYRLVSVLAHCIQFDCPEPRELVCAARLDDMAAMLPMLFDVGQTKEQKRVAKAAYEWFVTEMVEHAGSRTDPNVLNEANFRRWVTVARRLMQESWNHHRRPLSSGSYVGKTGIRHEWPKNSGFTWFDLYVLLEHVHGALTRAYLAWCEVMTVVVRAP